MGFHLKKLTAILLALLYSVVGLTGESLHYLVEDIGLAAMDVPFQSSGGYFHSHQPDNHVHFHRHHHHDQQPEAELRKIAKQQGEQDKNDLRPSEQFHHPHACPLLTIVSQLKLGHGLSVPIIVDSELSHLHLCKFNLRKSLERFSLSLARGPPSNACLA